MAIVAAKRNFGRKWGRFHDKPTSVVPAYPSEYVGLQVVDYYLWALQRMYELHEVRFFNLLASDFRLVMDIDDKRHKDYGAWYSNRNPLTLEKIKNL